MLLISLLIRPAPLEPYIKLFKECLCDPIVAKKLEPLEPGLLGPFRALWSFHAHELANKLNKRLKSWNDNPTICDLLAESIPSFEIYHQLIDNLANAIEYINACCEESQTFLMHLNLVTMKVRKRR